MSVYAYELAPDDNDTFLVTVPLLPEVTTLAETEAEAERHVRDAIEEAVAARMRAGQDVPTTAADAKARRIVVMPLLTSLKVDLYNAARAAGVTRAELQRRLGWNRTSVDRLFVLDHASRLDQLDAAFRALGRMVDYRIRPAPVIGGVGEDEAGFDD